MHRINRVLNSLIDQDCPSDALLLAVPYRSRREGIEYRIPAAVAEADAVTIVRCEDFGPATKLLPALQREPDPSTLIIAVDDDTIYPPDFIANLLAQHRQVPDAAIGHRGSLIAPTFALRDAAVTYGTEIRSATRVDVVAGCWGLMVQPRFFDSNVFDYKNAPPEAFFVDDIWFNGHMARRRVPRMVVPCRLPPMSSVLTRVCGLTFHENREGKNDELMARHFAEFWKNGTA